MAVITIDGKQYTVEHGKNLLEVCLSENLNLPYFCWHPAMGSVGACRQCAAKQYADENDTRGRLVTACMTPVQDGQIFSIEDQQAKGLRKTVIESLMTNHPHDCPVCEEGGECHLQDMTEMSGHTSRRYRGKKRTHNNQYLGPLINHEMNRCISCYRCVRFYNDYAGGKDLAAFASHNHVYFGREKDGVLENEFAGNLVEVCPTGVFTDKPFSEHYSRKWDLQTAPSICTHCAVGCNTTPGARYERIRRVSNRFHSEINGYFLCDRGRFGYAYNHDPLRITHSQTSLEAETNSVDQINSLVRAAEEAIAGKSVLVGMGSGRASLENNFALREFVGAEQFYTGASLAEYESNRLLVSQMSTGSIDIASIQQAEQADVVIILGEDIAETAPRFSLALRQASRNAGKESGQSIGIQPWQDAAIRCYTGDTKTPIFMASLTATRIDDICEQCLRADPQKIAQLGLYITNILDGKNNNLLLNDIEISWVTSVIDALKEAKRPLVVSGGGYLQPELVKSSLTLYNAIKKSYDDAKYYYAFIEANSLGLALLSHPLVASPHVVNLHDDNRAQQDLLDVLRLADKEKKRRVLIILENDLYRHMDTVSVDELLKEVDELIVLDHSHSKTTEKANSLFAVSTVLESQGTIVSSEGRAQRYYSVMRSADNVHDSWRWLKNATAKVTINSENAKSVAWTTLPQWQCCDDITHAMIEVVSILSPLIKLNITDSTPLARQSHRYSGRTAMNANISVRAIEPTKDDDSPFTYSMEGKVAHGALENSTWAPGWNSNQAVHKFQPGSGQQLFGGESGVCLFPYDSNAELVHISMSNESYGTSSSMQLYPIQHVFGSDELSAKSKVISQLAPASCVLMNSTDAQRLHVNEWDTVLCSTSYMSEKLYVRLDDTVPQGLAGVLQIGMDCISNHWPVAVTLVKENNGLPKPVQLIATDGEASYVC